MGSILPLYDRIIIRRMKPDEKSSGGIIIPEQARGTSLYAEVVVTGPGEFDKAGNLLPLPVKAGDVVLMSRYAGVEVEHDGEMLLMTTPNEVLAVVNK